MWIFSIDQRTSASCTTHIWVWTLTAKTSETSRSDWDTSMNTARERESEYNEPVKPKLGPSSNNTTTEEENDAHVSVLISLFELHISVSITATRWVYQANRGHVLTLYSFYLNTICSLKILVGVHTPHISYSLTQMTNLFKVQAKQKSFDPCCVPKSWLSHTVTSCVCPSRRREI